MNERGTRNRVARSLVGGLLAVAGCAHAAPVTWGSAMAETGNVSDIVTTGSLHGAVRGTTGDLTVNGVKFAGETAFSAGTLSFGASPIKLYGIEVATASYGTAPLSWGDYGTLVSSGGYRHANLPRCSIAANNCAYAEISNLVIGQKYTLQILESFWNSNWATQFSDGINSVTLNLAGGAVSGASSSSVPQYVVGNFTADATTQRIYMNSPTQHAIFTAMQVRTAQELPEPGSLLLAGAALAMLAGVARRRPGTALPH